MESPGILMPHFTHSEIRRRWHFRAAHEELLALLFEYSENLLQPLPDLFEAVGRTLPGGKRQAGLLSSRPGFGAEMLARSGDGESLVVKQPLDAQHILHVTLAIHSLAGAALHRLQHGEFGLPEAQYVSRQAADAGDLADAEVKLVGDHRIRGAAALALFFLLSSHDRGTERAGWILVARTTTRNNCGAGAGLLTAARSRGQATRGTPQAQKSPREQQSRRPTFGQKNKRGPRLAAVLTSFSSWLPSSRLSSSLPLGIPPFDLNLLP